MLPLVYAVAPEFLLLPIIAVPFIIWALARKAKALNAQGLGFSHRAKRNWCYVLIAVFVLAEIGIISFFFFCAGDLSQFAKRIQLGIQSSSHYYIPPLVWIYTFLLWGVVLGPLLIWWNVVSKKELSAERPDDYQKRNRRCNLWIVIGAAWFVLGLIYAAILIWIFLFPHHW